MISISRPTDSLDDGHEWNSLGVSEKGALGKSLIEHSGKNYTWWVGELNKWYDSTDHYRLSDRQ
jgi:hypothetical protein